MDLEYELDEARSEINRHHQLIAEMREGLEWALMMIQVIGQSSDDLFYLRGDDREKFDRYERLLNRQVG